jgi:hypothetical protein
MTDDRTLSAMHPALLATFEDAAGGWQNLNGWEIASFNTLYHETQIDLSGYAAKSLTYFPEAVGIQDPGTYLSRGGPGATYTALQVLDIITSVPMNIQEIADAQINVVGPGMLGSTREAETILMGQFRFFTPNTFLTYPNYVQLERSQTFGSGDPTAADKLFCYRIVSVISDDLGDGALAIIPAARQILNGYMDEETELVYMQRLKRSYELANQV